MIYAYLINIDPLYITSAATGKSFLLKQRTSGILLASKQIHEEFTGMLMLRSSLVLCFGRSHAKGKRTPPPPPPPLSQRSTHILVIVDLNGLKDPEWRPNSADPAPGARLLEVLEEVEATLRCFPRLQTFEIQWWNDLSVATDRSNMAEWIAVLIASGLVKTHELWFGYLNGRLNDPRQLRDHLLQQKKAHQHSYQRTVLRNTSVQLLEHCKPINRAGLKPVLPLSFF